MKDKPTGKAIFEALPEREKEIRIELQMQLNKVKGRSFTKEQIDQEVALQLAGKPGRLLASHGDTSTPIRESLASLQAREETAQRLQGIEDHLAKLTISLSELPAAFDNAFAQLRAELQVDQQQGSASVLSQVQAGLDRVQEALLSKIKPAPDPAPPAKKEDKAAV